MPAFTLFELFFFSVGVFLFRALKKAHQLALLNIAPSFVRYFRQKEKERKPNQFNLIFFNWSAFQPFKNFICMDSSFPCVV